MKRTQLFAGLIIVVGTLFATFFYYGYQMFATPNIQVKKGDAFIVIPIGCEFEQLMDSLDKYQIVTDRLSFAFLSKLSGYKEKIKPGYYKFSPNMTNKEAIWMLRSARQHPVYITFNSTRTLDKVAEQICRNILPTKEELLALIKDPSYIAEFGFDTVSIKTMFLPNTYQVYWNASAKNIFKLLNKEYTKFWNQERISKANNLGITPFEASVLASIVYEETKKNDEMPRVAGVYLNRLKDKTETNGLLQADPTVKYAVGDPSLKRILTVHTQIDHPYNTYKYPGLPPGPINIPSLQALEAVLNAEKHDYFYFCAKPDYSGYHNFASNYTQHLENRSAYVAFLNAEGIR